MAKYGQTRAIFSRKWLMLWRKKYIFINLSWHGGYGLLLSPFEAPEVPKTIVWPGLSKTPAHLATRRHHCISCKFGHQMALVQISWRHLHCFQSWPPDCVTCIATLPWIALLALSVSIELVSSSARVTSVKFQQGGSRTDIRTQRSDPRFTWVR